MKMHHYLVTLNLVLGSCEKTVRYLIKASDKKQAGINALTCECRDEPDFSEYIDQNACWDMGEFVYQVYDTKLVNPDHLSILKEYLWVSAL